MSFKPGFSSRYNLRLTNPCLLLPLLAVAQAGSEPLQSDWLDLVKGSHGAKLGAEVVNIEGGDTAATQKVTLKIPKKSMGNPDAIEEVIVVGRRPEKPEPLDITYEWLTDYDADNYGLVIRLGKNTKWPIRLYLNSDPGFVR